MGSTIALALALNAASSPRAHLSRWYLAQPSLVLLRRAATRLDELIRCVRAGELLGHGSWFGPRNRLTRPARGHERTLSSLERIASLLRPYPQVCRAELVDSTYGSDAEQQRAHRLG
jgi:hypothetical protein